MLSVGWCSRWAIADEKSTAANAWRSFCTTCWAWPIGGLRQGDDELVAAVAERQVGLAQRDAHAVGERLEHVVARGVAVRVVDLLELVHVDHHERQRLAVPLGQRDLALQELLHRPAVVQAGQRVGHALLLGLGQQVQRTSATELAVFT